MILETILTTLRTFKSIVEFSANTVWLLVTIKSKLISKTLTLKFLLQVYTIVGWVGNQSGLLKPLSTFVCLCKIRIKKFSVKTFIISIALSYIKKLIRIIILSEFLKKIVTFFSILK